MGVNPQTIRGFKRAAAKSPPPRPKTAHEQAEEKARSAFFSALTPEFFSHQVSNNYCQTEVYNSGLDTDCKNVYSCIFKSEGGWTLIDIETSDQGFGLGAAKEEGSILLLEDAVSRLKVRDDARRKISESVVISKSDLKNNHYADFAEQHGLCIDQKGSYHKKNTQGHITEETTFSLKAFNGKYSVENFSLEEHVTELFEHLVKNYLYRKFKDDVNFLDKYDWKSISFVDRGAISLLSSIWGKTQYDKKYFLEASFYEDIKKKVADVLLITSINSPCAVYIAHELKALPFRTDCDWSKIPKIKDMISQQFQKMEKEYQEIYKEMYVAPKPRVGCGGMRMIE